ncbi:unnamed protein product [Mytilus coruscus]|uniref:NCAM n=1 Tax=Mytilus coruscus TaxID=42192 RepID=A0A6J8BHT4_MYTCO|nr:unnamed protein product [Mytilus coruscus]
MSAVLKCQVDLNSKASWNGPDGNSGLVGYADGPDINPSLYNKGKLKIVGNIRHGEYNMEIRNVSEREDGLYTCYQINNQKMTVRETFVTLTVQYSPVIEINKTLSEHIIKFTCNPSGEPNHYSFDNWQHHSEFHEFIRSIKGSDDGTLTILRSNYNEIFNGNDGIYTCKASNGIADANGKLYQSGSIIFQNTVLPIFVNSNKAIEFGFYGRMIDLTVLVYNKFGSMQTDISKQNDTLNVQAKQENSSMNDLFQGVKVTVSGIKITFQLSLDTEDDFTSYYIKACNQKGCRPDPPEDVYVIPFITGIVVFWSQGFNGGFPQRFLLEYKTDTSIFWYTEVLMNDSFQLQEHYAINNLTPNTQYQVKIFSLNRVGRSKTTYSFFINTTDYELKCTNVYSYCVEILAILAGVMVMCLIISCIFCCIKRSKHCVVETSQEVRYDEIGTINFSNVPVDPTIHVSQENDIDNNDILSTSDSESSGERTFTGQTGDAYENPYQSIHNEGMEIHLYSSIISNNYENTIIFPDNPAKKLQKYFNITMNDIRNPWLIIYKKKQ